MCIKIVYIKYKANNYTPLDLDATEKSHLQPKIAYESNKVIY